MAESNVYTCGKARMVVDPAETTRRDRNCKYFIDNIEVPREDFVAYCQMFGSMSKEDPKLLIE